MEWPYKPNGEVVFEELAVLNSGFIDRQNLIILILLGLVLGITELVGKSSIDMYDAVHHLILIPSVIVTFASLIFFAKYKLITTKVYYRLRSSGIEFSAAFPFYSIPNPLFIPYENLLWLGSYPIREIRDELFIKYKVYEELGSFPTFYIQKSDFANSCADGTLIIFNGNVLVKTIVFWPSKEFLDKLKGELETRNLRVGTD